MGFEMKTDRTTKLLLALIALGLFLNAFKPISVRADTDSDLRQIADDIHHIADGLCLNHSLCH
jgi:hypothetical protein